MAQRTLEQLLEAVSSESEVWVRACAVTPDGGEELILKVLDLTAGGPPPNWNELTWTYPRAFFFAGVVSGEAVCSLIEKNSMSIADGPAAILNFQTNSQLSFERHASRRKDFRGILDWPYEEWSAWMQSVVNSMSGPLIGTQDTPSFVDVGAAVAATFGVEKTTIQSFDASPFVFRKQDHSGRINRIGVFPSQVEVDLEGDSLETMDLELAGAKPGPIVEVDEKSSSTYVLETPSGLALDSWVLLRRNGEWIDRKYVNFAHSTSQSDDVEFWVEPATEVGSLIASGEGPTTEFKQEIPDEKIKLMKTIAAFSNGVGGTILLGVANDGAVVGVAPEISSPDGIDSLTNMIRSWIQPLPDFEVRVVSTDQDSTSVVAIIVRKGSLPPYGAGLSQNSFIYYVRRGATTFAAAQDQVRALAQSTSQDASILSILR
jgi:hypothetical protein